MQPELLHALLLLLQEQQQYDPLADVKPALDRLHVEIDIQDLRVVQVRRKGAKRRHF